MLRVFYKKEDIILQEKGIAALVLIPREDIVWVDLQNPTKEEKDEVEENFDIHFRSQQEAAEIESSSRYMETASSIMANSNFMVLEGNTFIYQPVSFILRRNVLFTHRVADLKTFAETVRKIKANSRPYQSGTQVMLALFETRIDFDADVIESIARDISTISKSLSLQSGMDSEVLLKITSFQETTMALRENIIDKQRVISAMIRSDVFPAEHYDKLRIIIKDVNSLLEHTAFAFERLEYLQNTFLGLVNIEQNKIIKIFTVVSVVFMPPTLIASIYGMNFAKIPELTWEKGYPFALVLMVMSSLLTLYFFKKRNWL